MQQSSSYRLRWSDWRTRTVTKSWTFTEAMLFTATVRWNTMAPVKMRVIDADGAQVGAAQTDRGAVLRVQVPVKAGTYRVVYELLGGPDTNIYWSVNAAPAPVTETLPPPPPVEPPAQPPAPVDPPPVVVEPPVLAPAPPAPRSTVMPNGADYPFGPQNWFRWDVSKAPSHPRSAAICAHLREQVATRNGGNVNMNLWKWNSSFLTVGEDVPGVKLGFFNFQNKNYTPRELWDPRYEQMFMNVPLPDDAAPAPGTDQALSLWRPSTDQLWEFWKLQRTADGKGWEACWGGRMDNVSQSVTGAFPNWTGASATGLATGFGALSLADVERGYAEHVLAIVAPTTMRTAFSWPARRTDGTATHPDAPLQGMRFVVDPSVDTSKMHPVLRAVVRTAQKHGFAVVDTGGVVSFVGERGADWNKVLAGKAGYNVLAGFPWDKIRVLEQDYGKNGHVDPAAVQPVPVDERTTRQALRAGTYRPGPTTTGALGDRLRRQHVGNYYPTSGEVVEDLDIKDGRIVGREGVTGVKVRNVGMTGAPMPAPGGTKPQPLIAAHYPTGTGWVIEDTTIKPDPKYRGVDVYGVHAPGAKVIRCDISGVVDCVVMYGDDAAVEQSWLHDWTPYPVDPRQGGGRTHDDAIQSEGGARHRIVGNNIPGSTANHLALMLTQNYAKHVDLTVVDNFFDGGIDLSVIGSEKGKGPFERFVYARNTHGYQCKEGVAKRSTALVPATTRAAMTDVANRWDDGSAMLVRS